MAASAARELNVAFHSQPVISITGSKPPNAASLVQRELAKKLRVSHVLVHKSEIGERRVDITEFMDWCLACGIDPQQAFAALRQRLNL